MSPNIVVALIGGLALAGVLVFTCTVIYTEIREARQRVRTRMGYARLLEHEVAANGRLLEFIHESSNISWEDLREVLFETPPTDEVWKAVREQLAPLMKPEDFHTLTEHYRLLRVLAELDEPRYSDLTIPEVASDLNDEVPWLRSMLHEYENPSRLERWLGF